VVHQLIVVADPDTLAVEAARFVATKARAAVSDHGGFTFAVSGGSTPWTMFAQLAHLDMPWEQVRLFQVDERVAPDGDPQRNLTHLRRALGSVPADVVAMPVTDADLEGAADRYAELLPERLDLIHLGLGPDGHTASLVPGDPVLEVADRLVALTTHPYQGHRRMTLTYRALARGLDLMWLVAGEDKAEALGKLRAGDDSIPASRVSAARSTVIADTAAAGRQP
jgi:6-phosphogluconolactonase